jgi:RimJ/RimL family protein N-acetyltransferase
MCILRTARAAHGVAPATVSSRDAAREEERMLPGTVVDLRRAERSDLPTLAAWRGDIEVNGEFEDSPQTSVSEIEREFEADPDERWYIVQEKGGAPVGYVAHGKADGGCWIGCIIVPAARGRGYGTESIRLLVDYLFLHETFERIQAETHPANTASRRMLDNLGFTFEGFLRHSHFSHGEWRDTAMYSLLRGEWGGPRTLPGPHRD